MKTANAILAIAAFLSVCAQAPAAEPALGPPEVLNFRLLDLQGKVHELRRMDGKAVVLFFTANGCPVVRQSIKKLQDLQAEYQTKGVRLLLVNSNSGDDQAAIRKEMFELHAWQLPVLKDSNQGLARHLGIKRTADTVAISTRDWHVFYHGALDDQAVEGAQKPEPTHRYLRDALDAFLAGKPVPTPSTTARGCIINYDVLDKYADKEISYTQEIIPLLNAKCVGCHSRGNIGSWSMNGYSRLKGMSEMIQETILTLRMPPWDADPGVGHFANDCSLTTAEAQMLLRWIELGAPRGEGEDLLADQKIAPVPDWPLGPPDIILKLPKPEVIPATGVLDYRHIEVPANNDREGWVRATYIKPGNRRVVHHVIGRLKEGGIVDNFGQHELYCGWAPGTTQTWFPEGTGKFLPRNARFDIEMHYTTCGSEQTDETQIGLYLCKEKPAMRFESVPLANLEFEIPAGSPSTEVFATYCLPRPAMLHSLTPHMHLRGRWMRFELLTPEGRREVIASIPHFDFNWQRTYILKQPRRLAAGTWLLISGGYDNSPRNPANPDPAKTLHWGEQSWDEMFLGWYNVAWEPESPKQAAK